MLFDDFEDAMTSCMHTLHLKQKKTSVDSINAIMTYQKMQNQKYFLYFENTVIFNYNFNNISGKKVLGDTA